MLVALHVSAGAVDVDAALLALALARVGVETLLMRTGVLAHVGQTVDGASFYCRLLQ